MSAVERGCLLHGLILHGLGTYIAARLGDEEMSRQMLFQRAGLEYEIFLPHRHYESQVAARVLFAASELVGENYEDFLRRYGAFLVPQYLKMYEHSIRFEEGLTVFALLEQLEQLYERLRPDSSRSPLISLQVMSRRKAFVHLRSHELGIPKVCQLAAGAFNGIGTRCEQRLMVKHTTCVDRSHTHCTFELRPHIKSSTALPQVKKILDGLNGDDSEDDG